MGMIEISLYSVGLFQEMQMAMGSNMAVEARPTMNYYVIPPL